MKDELKTRTKKLLKNATTKEDKERFQARLDAIEAADKKGAKK